MDVLSEKIVKIKKEHICHGCVRSFAKGTKMKKIVCTDEGRLINSYWCKDCIKFMKKLDDWEIEEIDEGGLLEYDEYREKIQEKEEDKNEN